jgi:hypothetical protein
MEVCIAMPLRKAVIAQAFPRATVYASEKVSLGTTHAADPL